MPESVAKQDHTLAQNTSSSESLENTSTTSEVILEEVGDEKIPDLVGPKQIRIIRREGSGYIPARYSKENKIKLSSILSNRGPLRGLSQEEEKKYLPSLLGINDTDPKFEEEVRNFWIELTVSVPFGGVILEIGKDETGWPLNLRDWIIYRWSVLHKLVAKDKDDFEKDDVYKFYVHDDQVIENREHKKALLEIRALNEASILISEFNKGGKKVSKIDHIIRIMGQGINTNKMSAASKVISIKDFATSNPRRFIDVVNDENLYIKSFLMELVANNIVQKIGLNYIYQEITMGANDNQTINYIKNQRNSNVTLELKTKLEAVYKAQE